MQKFRVGDLLTSEGRYGETGVKDPMMLLAVIMIHELIRGDEKLSIPKQCGLLGDLCCFQCMINGDMVFESLLNISSIKFLCQAKITFFLVG